MEKINLYPTEYDDVIESIAEILKCEKITIINYVKNNSIYAGHTTSSLVGWTNYGVMSVPTAESYHKNVSWKIF